MYVCKFKIENVTQLLEFHALSDHQTVCMYVCMYVCMSCIYSPKKCSSKFNDSE